MALVSFARALREAGLPVSAGQVLRYCRGVAELDLDDAADLYWAGRSCLVTRHSDVASYDRVFARVFGGVGGGLAVTVRGELPRLAAGPLEGSDALWKLAPRPERPAPPSGTVASGLEVLRGKRFADCSAEELAALQVLMRRLRLTPPPRRTRRSHPAPRGRQLDLRRTVRRSLRSHAELVRLARRAPRVRPRRVVLLLDVSGSMAGYSRALLQFAHSAAAPAVGRTEVFCFGTRLTRITGELRTRQADAALARAAEAVVDWEGGTRIGASLRTFIRDWGRRGMARGALVVICSDGLERDDPALLGAQMARLARLAHRIVWVNPLKGDPRYQPLAGGMRAALPSVDVLVSGSDLASLEALADLLRTLAVRTRERHGGR